MPETNTETIAETIAESQPVRVDAVISERIRKVRKGHHHTQSELAEAIGLSRRTLCHYERKEGYNVPASVVFAVAQYYGVSLEYLFGLTDEPGKILPFPYGE